MKRCDTCHGRKKIERPVFRTEPLDQGPPPHYYVTCTFETLVEPCLDCYETGLGVNYDIVAERQPSVAWLSAEIDRCLMGGKPEEMERVIGTALDYIPHKHWVVGVNLHGLPQRRSKYQYVDCRIIDDLPTVPKGWSVRIRERKGD